MNFKLALAAAAVVGLAGTAQAADLAKKAPAAANYVKVCDAYGAGYFYIPGSDTCLKIGGYVRAEVRTGNSGSTLGASATSLAGGGINQSQRGGNGVYTRARLNLNFDARTATEYGLLRSYIEIWETINSGSTGTESMNVRQAFVQFGGLTAGRAQSFFDFVETSYNIGNIETDGSDHRANLLGYTFSFGNGITASLAVEDQSSTDFATGLQYSSAYYAGVKYPDLVANVNITQSWGRAQIMGALHDNYTSATTGGANADKWGFAVGAGVEVNLPMLAAGDLFLLQGEYTQGAAGYAIVNPVSSSGSTATAIAAATFNTRDFWVSGGSIQQTKAWTITTGFKHNFSKTWEGNLGASYASVDQFGAQDYRQTIAGVDLRWKPAAGFYIAGAVDYRNVDFTSSTQSALGVKDASAWLGTFRVQRSF